MMSYFIAGFLLGYSITALYFIIKKKIRRKRKNNNYYF